MESQELSIEHKMMICTTFQIKDNIKVGKINGERDPEEITICLIEKHWTMNQRLYWAK